jgi:sulfide:quinone oxidoreductase
MALRVVIAGGGPAALEAALALHGLADSRVAVTVVAPERELVERPAATGAAFGLGMARRFPVRRVAARAGAAFVHDRLAAVDAAGHEAETARGLRLGYDVLVVAVGGRPAPAFSHAITFTGSPESPDLRRFLEAVRVGSASRVAFVLPPGPVWPLPLYELALMTAQHAHAAGVLPHFHVVTPEPAPLAAFGAEAAEAVAQLLLEEGIGVHLRERAEVPDPHFVVLHGQAVGLHVDRVVSIPRIAGPQVSGLPADAEGFLPVDEHGAVVGAEDVYAAGDAAAHAVKHGVLAVQQADAVARAIAARAGAIATAAPYRPALEGVLLTEEDARRLGRGVLGAGVPVVRVDGPWWPPSKRSGEWLAPVLAELEVATPRPV